ncbi:ABC transporter ATP-binding protein [Rhodopseudomonas sp. P2A-2r]|uniref:ABC transporter ATP-binding protein n=1 Tax=unclassified Rhodopseudomonas TaxID=2638247 RepID=UPI002234C5B2|nr:ABC transporter ATP-binding protein [Rhodopseudomonas sp. P2A-2r]UZE50740.1 ABC transporter ATP-binding protein [Rhodopseudomonas sp. P2A-2r]
MNVPLLQVRDLSVSYGQIEAVRAVSLSVDAGAIVTVIGPNGAGKTTLLSTIMGLLPRQSGQISFRGQPDAGEHVEWLVAEGMSLVPETRQLFTTMSVQDNLLLGHYPRRAARGDLAASFDRVYGIFPRLKERRSQLAKTLSGGERQMLALGRALMSQPKLLLLDEPSLGLAPLIVREIFRVIADLRRTGVGILLVEQNARAALQVADYGYVMETGEISFEGPAAALADNPRIVASYLGAGRAVAPKTA